MKHLVEVRLSLQATRNAAHSKQIFAAYNQ